MKVSGRVLRFALFHRRLRGAIDLRVAMLLFALLLVGLFLASSLIDNRRTFVVEAQTTALELTFQGDANAWRFSRATVCSLRTRPDLTRVAGNASCDARFYDITEPEEVVLRWPPESSVRVTLDEDGTLAIATDDGAGTALSPRGRIIIAPDVWHDAGALTFTAHLTIGAPIGAGQRHFLSGGRWEARETGFATGLLRANVTEVVKSGTLIRGGTATIWTEMEPGQTYGHISPGASFDGPHLELVALSRPGDSELRMSYFGATEPAVIRPDLIDVAISSPLLLAIAVVLSVMASLTQLHADVGQGLGKKTRDVQDGR